MTRVSSGLCMRLAALAALCTASAGSAAGAGVPIDGFLPLVAITLTDEFVNDLDFFPYPSTSLGGSPVSSTAGQWYELALLDSGAAVSLITAAADAAFNIGGPRPGNNDGFRGTETITIGGATGFLQASIGDPLGLYAAGVQGRTASSGPLSMNPTAFQGQTNTSLVTLPAESTLPNILGLSFMSQYATRIRNSQPQVFEADGKTVRTPAIDFLPLGSGDTHGIARKAPMSLLGAGPSTPLYFPNIANLDLNRPWENPSQPTVVQGGHFLNINAANNGSTLSNQQFFFDTGASVTVLSELTALQLGIDVQLDTPDFTIQIIGSGGLSDAIPGYFLDSFTVLATGGSVTATNVPILVFDVTNPASPGNIVPGIVGTNMFAGRDIIIDPNPSQGGGGASAGVYISDPVTVTRNWTSAAPSAAWSTAGHWSGGAVPTLLGIANVQHVSGGHQQAVVSGEAVAWSAKVAGAGATQTMTLSVATGAKLTTFSGTAVAAHGVLSLEGGVLDAQYVELRDGGVLRGAGFIRTGSGPIAGQVENVSGVVTPGNGVGTLHIDGRYSNGPGGQLLIDIGGLTAGTQYDQLVVDGPATLGGALGVSLVNLGGGTFVPGLGAAFDILTTTDALAGKFAAVDLPLLPADRMWHVGYSAGGVTLRVTLPGDFNGDGTVAADDLADWQAGLGSLYDGSHFLAWQRHVGMSLPGAASVPEPSAAALAAGLIAALAKRRRR